MTGPVIKLKGYRIKNIEYNLILDNLENQAEDVVNNTSVKCSLTNELDFGQIELSSTFNDISNDRTINVTLLGQFDINPDLDDEIVAFYHNQAWDYTIVILSDGTQLDVKDSVESIRQYF